MNSPFSHPTSSASLLSTSNQPARESTSPTIFHQALTALRLGDSSRLTDTLHKSSVIYTLVLAAHIILYIWYKGISAKEVYEYLESVFNSYGLLSTSTSKRGAKAGSPKDRCRKRRKRMSVVASEGTKPQKVRKVLLIDQHGARMESVAINYKAPPGQTVKRLVNAEEATRILNENATTYGGPEGSGIWQVQQALLASNDPMEDKCSHVFYKVAEVKENSSKIGFWNFFGVYDGHYGAETSSILQSSLISDTQKALQTLHDKGQAHQNPTEIETTIRQAFINFDKQILSASKSCLIKGDIASSTFKAATQGSCALLAFHDSQSNIIRIALTGDSRAVLGRRIGAARWIAKPLSVDQTLSTNDLEEKRVKREHPGESVIENNRMMGDLAVSRAFGDVRFKWNSRDLTALDAEQACMIKPEYHTPPYVTAEPIISSVEIRPRRDDFLILGSDGLWDFLTNEDAVAIVGRWLDDNHRDQTNGDLTRPATKLTADQEANFVFIDDNAGVHLIRNALGGSKEGRVRFSLTVPPGKDQSKRFRDDLTAMVIFFD